MVVALKYILPAGIAGACVSHARPETRSTEGKSKKPFIILMAASVLYGRRFAAITFLPMYLVSQGYDLVTASMIMTLMLLSGVA